MIEVEQKYRLVNSAELTERLISLGAIRQFPLEQRDRYFAHPVRDFAMTDEALRLRSNGSHNVITFKGPKQGSAAKTRMELEIPFAEGNVAAGQFERMLVQLGFRVVRDVVKLRVAWTLNWQGREAEVTIDDVKGLGLFAEVEVLATESDRCEAEDAVVGLSEQLGLIDVEHRSYLEMLIEQT